MILERKGLKNIYQPFLCYDGFLYTITESPASFGDSPNAFENYISEHLVVTEGDSATANLYLSFTINCHGEVAEVITDSYNLSELEKSIVELIKHMPNWTAGTQRGKAVNFKKQYKFVYDKGELIIYKGR